MPFYLTDKPQLICPECGYYTRRRNRFKEHNKSEHPGIALKPIVKADMESKPLLKVMAK